MKVAHIADIHIQDRRREEYAEVFNKLYAQLSGVDLILLLGDIFDNKMRVSANNMDDCMRFLENLTQIAPVIAIPGNHDLNCFNPGSLDLLTPLIENNETLKNRLTYWRYNGIYKYEICSKKIEFTVIAPDNYKKFDTHKVESPDLKICLFHDEIDGVIYSKANKLQIENEDYYDLILGGHIHNRQIIRNKIAYCGSLIQQNIGESHIGHGGYIWDFNTLTANEFNIPSKGFMRIILESNEDKSVQVLTNPIYWDIVYDNCSDEFVNSKLAEYEKLYNCPPKSIRRLNECHELSEVFEETAKINLTDTIIKILEKDAKSLLYKDDVLALHAELYKPLDSIGGKFRLLSLEFNDMYIFGEGNNIDFTKLERQISGVIAPNHSGKSSLIDILIFALFEEHPRTSTKKDIIFASKPLCSLKVSFELHGKLGIITKLFYSNTKQSTYSFTYDGENLSGGTTNDTLINIEKYLGDVKSALSTSFQLQGMEYTGFVSCSATERKKLLSHILSINSFEEVDKIVSAKMTLLTAELKSLRARCKMRDESYYIAEIERIDNILSEENEILNTIKTDENNLQEKLNILSEQYGAYSSNMERRKRIEQDIVKIMAAKKSHGELYRDIDVIFNEINRFNKKHSAPFDESKCLKDCEFCNKYKAYKTSFNKVDIKPKKSAQNCSACSGYKTIDAVSDDKLESLQSELNIPIVEFDFAEFNRVKEIVKSFKLRLSAQMSKIAELARTKSKLEFELETYRELIESLTQAEKQYNVLSIYKDIVKPNGGVNDLILENVREKLQFDITNTLHELGGQFDIFIDDKFNILHKYGDRYLSSSVLSGYQKFVLGLASRLTLWRMMTNSKLDAFIIDEGFGACDLDHLDAMTRALEVLSTAQNSPRLLFIVSHIDELKMKITAPIVIDVKKNGNYISNSISYVVPVAETIEPVEIQPSAKVKCDVCNVFIAKSYVAKHNKTPKHLANIR